MITLYGFGRAFGLPDPSPFVTKTEVLLRMSKLPFERKSGDMGKAPKGKLPYISDDGVIIADSTFIRWHLEAKYGIDFDAGYSPAERAVAWAFEKTCEDHTYWATVRSRWLDDANFNAGPRKFFDRAPALIRPLVIAMVRRKIRRNLSGQGMGRHSQADVDRLAIADLRAFSDFLGDKPFLLGDRPCGSDAVMFAFSSSALCTIFRSALREAAEGMPNIVAYRDRMQAKYFPEGY